MKIGFVTSLRFHEHTGARTRAQRIYQQLSQTHNVDLLNVNIINKDPIPDEFNGGGDFAPTSASIPGTVREIIAGKRLISHCRKEEYDLLWSYHGWQHTPVVTWISSELQHIPLIVGVNDHQSGTGIKGTLVNEILRKHIYKQADLLVTESETLETELRELEIPPRRINTIPTGIDINEFYRPEISEADSPTAFYVGRDKDLDLLFEAASIVKESIPDLCVQIAGVDQEAYPKITEDYITFLGYVSDEKLRTKMGAAHVCVVPYRNAETAGRPVKLLEYMSAKKCIVGTDLPFNRQMIRDGENGLLVDTEPKAFAARLKTALRNEKLRHRLAKQAREDVCDFSLKRMSEEIEKAVARAVETNT